MKNKPKNILNTDKLVIILSLIITAYFIYSVINPIIKFINTDIDIVDNISAINQFFE